MNEWHKVLATHEEKQYLSSGDWLGDRYPGVALPCANALHKWVELQYRGNWTIARVMDVGPWTIDDDAYVFGNAKPRAEIMKGDFCPISICGEEHRFRSNGAGIDLFPETAKTLFISLGENVELQWRFIDPSF